MDSERADKSVDASSFISVILCYLREDLSIVRVEVTEEASHTIHHLFIKCKLQDLVVVSYFPIM
jgi:hypothetical protein